MKTGRPKALGPKIQGSHSGALRQRAEGDGPELVERLVVSGWVPRKQKLMTKRGGGTRESGRCTVGLSPKGAGSRAR